MDIFRHRKSIRVRYRDGRKEKIPAPLLNTLIETKKITAFKRKGGWAVIGQDPIRGMDSGSPPKKERRH